jgi:ankyrin repeat protein
VKKLFSLVGLFCFACAAWPAEVKKESAATSADDFLRVIRANDLKALKQLSRPQIMALRDRLEWTPLHYAALFGSTEAVRILLDSGSDPNARNRSQATPLMYAAYSLEKTRLLVEKGGDVNARTNDGTTPLWVAAGVPGNMPVIRYLAGKGADLKQIRPDGGDLLIRATPLQDPQTVRFLLDHGLDPHHADQAGDTALIMAASFGQGGKAAMLIQAGSDVNAEVKDAGHVRKGPIALTQLTPLMFAASNGDADLISALLKAGAKINAVDVRHMSPLMHAVASDNANPEAVRRLVSAGADVNLADQNGETALDWAQKYRNAEVTALIGKAGGKAKGLQSAPVRPADYKPDAATAVSRATSLLVTSGETFFRESGCVGCHHQPFAGRAFGAIKGVGMMAEPKLRQNLTDGMVAERARELNRLPLMMAGGGGYESFLYPLSGLAAMEEPASMLTDVMIHFVAANQAPSGAWISGGPRPPISGSSITATALAIDALKSYSWPGRSAEFGERIARARKWLESVQPSTTVEAADRLTGLWRSGAPQEEVREAGRHLLSLQRANGGWAQRAQLDTDAYGTSVALSSLARTGVLKASDAAYRRGAQFLLDTQFPDGSWYVRSRAVKLQPYFQSAFPYDHDQWISNSATAYAVVALAPVVAH